MLRRSTPLLDMGRGASAPDVVEWELERGGKTEPALPGMAEPELASAPDRGLDAQPVPASDRGLDALAVKRLEWWSWRSVLHALEAAAPARVAATSTTSSRRRRQRGRLFSRQMTELEDDIVTKRG